jgi:hypothetical protein
MEGIPLTFGAPAPLEIMVHWKQVAGNLRLTTVTDLKMV